MKWLKAISGLLVITLLFASCIKVEGEVVINDDGSGEVDFLTAVDADRIGELLGEIAGSPDQICDEFASDQDTGDLPDNASVSEYDEDGFCGARIEYELPASLDHSADMSDLFDEQTTLFKEGDNWFFESQFSADEITSDAEDFGDIDEFFGDASFKIIIDLPGRAIPGENNATAVGNDGRFTWDIDLLNPPTSLFAQTEPGSGGGTGGDDGSDDGDGGGGGFLRVLLLLAVLGLLGAGIWWFLKNRGSSDATAGAPTDTPSPVAGMPQDPAFGAPIATGPPVMDAAPGGAGTFPTPDASKETVIMSSEEAQRLAAEARGQAPGGIAGAAGGLGNAAGGIAGAAGGLGNAASGAAGGLTGAAGGAIAGAASGLGDAASGLTGAAGDAASGLTGAAGDAASGLTGAAGDAASGMAGAAGDAASGMGDAAGDAASSDPTWDEALSAWVIDHPTRGRLRHDPASDSWNPI